MTTRFTCDQNVVTDSRTGLMWQRNVPEDRFKLKDAKQYAAELRIGGYSNWRVPTLQELVALVDRTKHEPYIDTEAFPNTPLDWFWTVSPYDSSNYYVWVVYFGNGDSSSLGVNYPSRVRCVR